MKIVLTGSSGFIGSDLSIFLKKQGHEVFNLVRTKTTDHPDEIVWDPENNKMDPSSLEGMDVVIHLAGEPITGRWTDEKKKKIYDSRIHNTHFLSVILSQLRKPPSLLICASAIGIYGDRGDEILTERSSEGIGFLSEVCKEWEEAVRPAAVSGIRTINLRLGVVLSKKGGALKEMLVPFKWGIGGQMGSGNQYMSWIALEDVISIIDYVIHNPHLAGPINVVSPQPVKNQGFTKVLGDVLNRPTFFTMPEFMVKLIFGEMGEELLLSSTRAIPERLNLSGFQFKHQDLRETLMQYI